MYRAQIHHNKDLVSSVNYRFNSDALSAELVRAITNGGLP